MQFTTTVLTAVLAAMASAQSLKIPTRVGSIVSLSKPETVTGSKDYGNKEYDRGRACNSDKDTGSASAVFILENGASISNVIIGANQLEGVHCKGACTLKNVWFRDVCEDAISVLGTGNVLIQGGGAQNAKDKVVQHNGKGTVTIKDYTVVSVGKLFRSCGNCSKQYGPRSVTITNLKANGVTADIAGINSNYGDVLTISGSCGTGVKNVCQEFKGILKSAGGESPKLTTKKNCRGAQGLLKTLPKC
ncbi:hypothetical protein IFR04_009390 [Cadophora malorum]|uniref:Pectate lyase n=1 Tax=Cadophora malorum TaxID=108018 RepID=A0A8H7W6U5_9HELO|nr:hypothetical protein IFR04_009390 [Cadophora malorum]